MCRPKLGERSMHAMHWFCQVVNRPRAGSSLSFFQLHPSPAFRPNGVYWPTMNAMLTASWRFGVATTNVAFVATSSQALVAVRYPMDAVKMA
jgi:hypothetical protein